MSEKETIGVIGVGWVGLVTAACFAETGRDVVAVDIDEGKVTTLRAGEVDIHEPGIEELLERNRDRLTFTTEMGEVLGRARLLFCCVDTPPTYSGDADLSRVQAVVRELSDDGGHALVMKSTVPAGTGAAIRREMPSLSYVSCPEFLKEGSAVDDFLHPDRVVIGADAGDEWAADAVEELYRPLGGEVVRTDVASAEMVKLASNAFLATKISFINEIANVSEEVGADVTEVARGMGLDKRIGPAFLRAGIGYGGSCFDHGETVLVRHWGTPRLTTFADLWEAGGGDKAAINGEAIEPESLEAWSWVPGESEPEWMPVTVLTRRQYDGEMVEVRTKMGRRVRVTRDHPFVVSDGKDDEILTRVLASELTTEDWLPLALGARDGFAPGVYSVMGAIEDGAVDVDKVRVRVSQADLDKIAIRPRAERVEIFSPRDHYVRLWHASKSNDLRLKEAAAAGIDLNVTQLSTPWSRALVPPSLEIGPEFWRILGLYLAEGCVIRSSKDREAVAQGLLWSFHPTAEHHLVEEVVAYWARHGIEAKVNHHRTSERVMVHSRLLAAWWEETLGLGRNGYEQRIPDLAWEQSRERREAMLGGMWEGDGYWTVISHGRSPVLEWGTVSDELAEGVVRMLGDLGIVGSWYRGRVKGSTKETHWVSISGAGQIERAMFLVPERERPDVERALARQLRRMSPAGFRRFDEGMAWVRVTQADRVRVTRPVYSLEVPGSHTVVTSGGLVASNCFPKDLKSLKQLAGNTGYHFQLLTSVIEVNELQKRRLMKKLEKHLGSLAGKKVALLGLAFKPNTDDMREATSLVLSARLQGEGAVVRAYDPVAVARARELLKDVEFANSAEDALDGADAAILVTEWPEFAELDWAALAGRMATPLLVDGRNFLDPEALRAAGFTYEGIGRPG